MLLPWFSDAQIASMWHHIIITLSTVFRLLISDTDIAHLQHTNILRQSISYFLSILSNLKQIETFYLKPSISNLKKIRPVGDELFHVGGRTDRHVEIRESLLLIWQRRSRLDSRGSWQASVVCLVYKLTPLPVSWNRGITGYLRNFSFSGGTLLCRFNTLQ